MPVVMWSTPWRGWQVMDRLRVKYSGWLWSGARTTKQPSSEDNTGKSPDRYSSVANRLRQRTRQMEIQDVVGMDEWKLQVPLKAFELHHAGNKVKAVRQRCFRNHNLDMQEHHFEAGSLKYMFYTLLVWTDRFRVARPTIHKCFRTTSSCQCDTFWNQTAQLSLKHNDHILYPRNMECYFTSSINTPIKCRKMNSTARLDPFCCIHLSEH